MKNSEPSLLVEKLMAAGFTLTADGSRLRVAPADLLTDELRAGIRENKAALLALLAVPTVRSTTDTTPAATMQHRADMAPSRLSCGTCLHFVPDTINPAQGVGTCKITGAGPPSAEHGDYRACYPLAKRYCDTHEIKKSQHTRRTTETEAGQIRLWHF